MATPGVAGSAAYWRSAGPHLGWHPARPGCRDFDLRSPLLTKLNATRQYRQGRLRSRAGQGHTVAWTKRAVLVRFGAPRHQDRSGPGRQREQTTEAVTSLRDLENARLDALQLALWEAAMT
jgi:hypothetical protein